MKGILKRIISEQLEAYYNSGKSEELKKRPILYTWLKKMLKCGSLSNGVYKLLCKCGKHTIYVPITCKTKVCLRCSWAYQLKQKEKTLHKMLPENHYFVTFTIPHDLHVIFETNRKLFLSTFNQAITDTIKGYVKKRGLNVLPGIVSIPHTFGSYLQRHVHFHCLITQGGMDKKSQEWVKIHAYPIDYLKNKFRQRFLKRLRMLHKRKKFKFKFEDKKLYDKDEFNQLLDISFKRSKQWHTNIVIEDKKHRWKIDNGSSVNQLEYAIRYLCRLPISEHNIVAYNGTKVTWYPKKNSWEKTESSSNASRKLLKRQDSSVEEFLEYLLKHVPDKNERVVYYSGLYCPYEKDKLYKKAFEIFNEKAAIKKDKEPHIMDWSEMRTWHTKGDQIIDPTFCSHCNSNATFVEKLKFDPEFCRTHILKNNQIVPIIDSS